MSEGRSRGAPRTAGRAGGGGRGREAAADTNWGRATGGQERMAREREANENRRNRPFAPFRFYLDNGGQSEIVILDDITNLNDLWYMFEHAIPGPRMNWKEVVYEPCPKEWEDCPICAEAGDNPKGRFSNSSYVMCLSIVEDIGRRVDGRGRAAEPYKDRDGVEHWSGKRELAMKPTQAEAYERLFEAIIHKHGTLRGACIRVARGRGDQSSRTGAPVINPDTGEMYEILTEEQMDEFFGNDEVRNEKGEVVKAENDNITAYNYGVIHPRPSADDILERWSGLSAASGSQADIDRTLREGEGRGRSAAPARGRGAARDEDTDDGGRGNSRGGSRETRRGREEPSGTTGARGRGRTVVPQADPDLDPPDDAGRAPARGRGAAAAPPSRARATRGAAAPAPQEDPPARQAPSRSRAAAPAAAPATRVPATRAAPSRAAPRGRAASTAVADDDIPY